MLKVGLTGGIASGKSTICRLFSRYNVPIIDADIIARELVEPDQPAFDEIVQLFGQSIVRSNGTLNRPTLRQLIFSSSKAKKQLENILHPKISEQLQQQSDKLDTPYCILAIPLLIESKLQHSVDRILVIDIDLDQQLKRLCSRDNISITDAQKIIDSQCNRQQRLSAADDIVINNQSFTHLEKIINNLDKKYRHLASSSSHK